MSPCSEVMSSGCEIASLRLGVACMMCAPVAKTRAANTDRWAWGALRPWAGSTAAPVTTQAAARPIVAASARGNQACCLMRDLFSTYVYFGHGADWLSSFFGNDGVRGDRRKPAAPDH